MRGWIRRARAVALVLLVLPLSGCDFSWLTVRIPDFDSKKVQGIWVWRQSETNGSWLHDVRITFQGVQPTPSVEWLTYDTVIGTLGQRGPVKAVMDRTAGKPDEVTVTLGFIRLSAPGTFRVTTFNSTGESPLSTDSKHL